MLNNVPLRERSGCPAGGLLLHPSPLLFPRVPSLDLSTERLLFFFFPSSLGDPSLHLRARHSPLRGAGAARHASRVPRRPQEPGIPMAACAPGCPAAHRNFLLPTAKPALSAWKTLRGPPSPHALDVGENLLPLGANGPCTPMGSRSGPSGARPTCRHAGKGGRASELPGLLLHAHRHPCPLKGFFFPPSPTILPLPMLFFTSAFVCHWQESKLLFLLPLRFKWSWQIKPS